MSIDSQLITQRFEEHARKLDRLPHSKTARHYYELMSGGLLWEDEACDLPISEMGWFRAALAYRSSVLLGEPRTQFEPVWTALKRIAPNWPGFRVERCEPSPELVASLREQKKKSDRSLDRLEAAMNGQWKPLSGKPSKQAPPNAPH